MLEKWKTYRIDRHEQFRIDLSLDRSNPESIVGSIVFQNKVSMFELMRSRQMEKVKTRPANERLTKGGGRFITRQLIGDGLHEPQDKAPPGNRPVRYWVGEREWSKG